MNEIISIMAIVMGGLTSIASVFITYKLNMFRDKRQDKYVLTKEVFDNLMDALTSIYSNSEKNDLEISATDFFTDALNTMYTIKRKEHDGIKNSYFKCRCLLPISDVEKIEEKIRSTERINRRIYCTRLNEHFREKDDYNNIEINEQVEILDNSEDIQTEIRSFIEEVGSLGELYTDVLEARLRKLLN